MKSLSRKQKRSLVRIVAAAVLLAVVWLLSRTALPPLVTLLLFILPYLMVGYDVLWAAVRNILHGQVFDEKFLMTVATVGAFCIQQYPEAVAVMLFYQVGELFQSIAVGKSRRSVAALMDIRPDCATVLREGQSLTVSPEEVEPGETILIRPGEKIPLDGEILDGVTAVNTAALTGESLPAEKGPGDSVISGSINLSGVIQVRTLSRYEDSTVERILELVENASEKKARTENFITRFARWYTPCVVIAAVLLALIPPLLLQGDWNLWIRRALTFLVVSCPCALVVSVPLSFFGGIGRASRDGILIKGSNYLEALSRVNAVLLDKTGTLTRGTFAVEKILPNGVSKEELLHTAAALESRSRHPVAVSVVQAWGRPSEADEIQDVQELAGLGVRAVMNGIPCYAGSKKLLTQAGVACMDEEPAGTVVHVARGRDYLGCLVIRDTVKPEAKDALCALRALGVEKAVMLTGDSLPAAQAVGNGLGLDEMRAGLLPQQKVQAVEEYLSAGYRVAFVGDGINDAPVLARSNVGIAMGAMGSDAAIESADIVLMDDQIAKLPKAMALSRRTMRIVRQNIWFALLVKAAILILSAVGITGMWLAVFGDVGVMVLAVLNAMRILLSKK